MCANEKTDPSKRMRSGDLEEATSTSELLDMQFWAELVVARLKMLPTAG